jgi:hypothetical protein
MRAATHLRRASARKQNQKFIGFGLMKEGVGGGKDCLGMKTER